MTPRSHAFLALAAAAACARAAAAPAVAADADAVVEQPRRKSRLFGERRLAKTFGERRLAKTAEQSDDCTRYKLPEPLPNELPSKGLRVLVTGGAGFIGSHVAALCIKLGMVVTIVDDLSGGFRENLPRNMTFIQGDVKDANFVDRLFYGTAGGGRDETLRRFDFVYHLAAYAAEGLSHFIRSYNYRNNLVASMLLVNAAVKTKVRCFIFTSSIAVYGAGQVPMIEETLPTPEDPYGISKYAVELDLAAAKRMFDMDFIIARPHNVYGPGQNVEDKYRNVVSIFLQQLKAGKDLTIFGDGTQTRSFTYIRDVADVVAKAPLHPHAYNQVFNVGAETPYQLNDLAKHVAEAWGSDAKVRHLEARKEVANAESSHAKMRCYFGSTLHRPMQLKLGLRKTVDWAKEFFHVVPTPRESDAVEVLRELPPAWRRPNMKEVPEWQGFEARAPSELHQRAGERAAASQRQLADVPADLKRELAAAP